MILLLGNRRTDALGAPARLRDGDRLVRDQPGRVRRPARPRRGRPSGRPDLYTWVDAGSFKVDMGLLYDPLSAVFLLLITGVGSLIHIYSVGYMEHDVRRARFFGYLNLFVAAMLMLVLADNYLGLFLGWEGVGLASYLLIGFWQHKTSAAVAAKKAFVVNRVGDIGMALGDDADVRDLRHRHVRGRLGGRRRGRRDDADRRSACCSCSPPAASRPRCRCSPGCSTRWRARPRSRP